MNMTYRSGNFSRVSANEAKMGAYYTDPSHCRSIGEMFRFPEECCLLEPCIGDGTAVMSLTEGNPDVKIFGVELNDKVADETKKKEGIEECIHADFLDGVMISQNAFSFCFCNPPYMDDEIGNEHRERMEKTFLSKITTRYLKKGGVLVFVIPERILPVVGRILISNYEEVCLYRFWPEEYAKWHQVVYVGIKTDKKFCSKDEVDAFMKRITAIEELPLHPSECIMVQETKALDVKTFCCREFDVNMAYNFLSGDVISAQMGDYNHLMEKLVTQEKFTNSDIGTPPIPLKKDSLYLMSTSGVGQGLAGTEGKDLHLQRGCAQIVEDEEYIEPSSSNGEASVRVTSRTQITMKVIQTNGSITTLA